MPARIVERTIGTSGQFPVRLGIGALILMAVLADELQIDLVLAAFVVGAVVRASVQPQGCSTLTDGPK